nr:zinc finger domain-containing protein [Serratia marcescens]
MAVSSSAGSKKLELDEIRDLILGEDVRRRESGESSGAALNVSRGRGNQRGKGKVREDITCWNCGSQGHFASSCRNPKNKNLRNPKNTQQDEEPTSNVVEGSQDVFVCSADSPEESWILDSGASYHSTSCREVFHNFVSRKAGSVYLADGKSLSIEGEGEVCIKTENKTQLKLQKVRYVPGLRRSLISMSQLDSLGYKTVFSGGS